MAALLFVAVLLLFLIGCMFGPIGLIVMLSTLILGMIYQDSPDILIRAIFGELIGIALLFALAITHWLISEEK